jgi:hypothetical protein
MKKLLSILVIHSAKDLFKHKSFFLLIFALILADRGLKILQKAFQFDVGLPDINQIDLAVAAYIFDRLPEQLIKIFLDFRFFVVLIGLFLLKQIISLWPSSDMRRMHRQEREQFGLLASLIAIRWEQVLWDAIAVFSLCLVAGIWCLFWFAINRLFWHRYESVVWIFILALSISAVFPMILAGASYSSKLAVISRGGFGEKLKLFFKLFSDRRVALWSWLFYAARLMLETIFVAAIPAYILLTVDNYVFRIILAALLATPVYSYLKMASFKFFLVVYDAFPLVKHEYASYYQRLAGRSA